MKCIIIGVIFMHKIFNISLGIVLVFYIFFSLLIDGKDLPFIYLGIVLLFASVLLRQQRYLRKR